MVVTKWGGDGIRKEPNNVVVQVKYTNQMRRLRSVREKLVYMLSVWKQLTGAVMRLVCLLPDRIKRDKGVWWMPWQQEAMKDAIPCDKLWGAGNRL